MELKEYGRIIAKRIWLIVAIVVIACVATAVKTYYFTTPVYKADTKLIVNQQSTVANGAEAINYNDIQTNIKLINSYKEIIKSAAIMDKVAQIYPDLKLSSDELSSRVSVSSASDSQVMNLSFRSTSYTQAAKAVNAIAKVFKDQIPLIMKVDNVAILNTAKIDNVPGPINSSPSLNMMIAFIVSLMIAIGLSFLLDYLDDTIKGEQDIANVLDLPMLAMITKFEPNGANSRKPSISQQQSVKEGKYAAANQ
ncbi:YveK family protein [Paenibacillus beijingensis]|uniref:Lipopolysaccharide biosynthesis protein n=1 Tax=Paenibacillus beijingensis TaxID=1126833 RepID=A0A0D5NF14_9BACL|nr:Wzz/FepE/Etk N-terminal domain-containing protein [Paenibacillus beijingensis]AJY73979.1 lipopolysaccharide biosynthesis protein [Paenibacillus beijingensis]